MVRNGTRVFVNMLQCRANYGMCHLVLYSCVCIIQEMLQGLCYESCIKLSCHDCHAQWLAFVGKCCRVLSRLLSRSVPSCFSNFGRKFPSGRQLKTILLRLLI